MGNEKKNRSLRMIMAPETFKGAERISHVPALCKKNKLSQSDFVRAAGFLTKLSRPTLEKAYKGDTDLDLSVIEKLAWYFGVETNEIIESKFKQ
jgi:transcriptional regulator with XRE-family HTH domain